MVYVLSSNGVPLMPTERYGKVRRLLSSKKAKVVRKAPFTIQLLYETTEFVQELTLGVDAGSKHIGLSVTSEEKEYYASDVEVRNDIVSLLSQRRTLRRARRNRKTRYRKARFNNRIHSKHKGWLAPSVEEKIGTHIKVIENVLKILPVSKIVIETASFDTQLLKAESEGKPIPEGKDYQQGEQMGFWNIREYVLFRDEHKCRCCKGKSNDKVLNVHHLESRKTGGNSPTNLITLCETCHKAYHNGKIELPEDAKRGEKYNDAAFMGIMRWTFFKRLKEKYPNIEIKNTFGYITKTTRIRHKLPKEHYVDARCISGHPEAKPAKEIFYQRKIRCHNRQLHKCTILKKGIRKSNQAPKTVKGFKLFDRVKAEGRFWYVNGRRTKGHFVLKNFAGEKLDINPTKIKLISHQGSFISEMRCVT